MVHVWMDTWWEVVYEQQEEEKPAVVDSTRWWLRLTWESSSSTPLSPATSRGLCPGGEQQTQSKA